MSIELKQLSGIFGAPIKVTGISASGASTVITTAITTALSSAGRAGAALPLQPSTSENTAGVVVSGSNNLVNIWSSGDKLKDLNGNEVYGRLTHSSGIYTLTYYSAPSGTETAYSLPSSTIEIEFNYRAQIAQISGDFAISVSTRNVSQDPKGSAGYAFAEKLTVTATNTVSNLSKTPLTNTLEIIVNGVSYSTFGGVSAPVSLSAKVVTWSSSNAGFSIETTDEVIARYNTTE